MPLILALLLYLLIGVVVWILVYVLAGGASADENSSNTGTLAAIAVELVTFVYVIFVQAAFLSGTLDIADGRPVTVTSFFKPRNFGTVIVAAALLAVISAALGALSLIPPTAIFGIVSHLAVAVFSFFTLFTIAFATDRGVPPIDALKASFSTVRSNIGSTLLSWLVQAAIVLVGLLLCGIGLIVAGPLALLIQVYTYRRLSGGSVAPLSQ
jgi:uncharacterized membrane protein